MGVARQISDMIGQARAERKANAARAMAKYASASERSLDAQRPGLLTKSTMNTILMAIATRRPVSWQYAWTMLHRIKSLEAELAKHCPSCECEPVQEAPPERIAGEPKIGNG